MTSAMPVADDAAFRGALGRFASGVTVVTTVTGGVHHAMTASAFTSVSLDPPQVLVCSDRSSRFHDAVVESGVWGISILTEAGERVSARFARKGRPLDSQFDGVPYRTGELGVPLLDGALAWLECRTRAVHDGGDHSILLGDVVAAGTADVEDAPLVYYRSHYARLVRSSTSETSYDKGER
ncbi:flavin reductase-like protein [Aeromicrobium marinum DSM 15272]|uniref:Flavin reductase-like protein n=1 Tax=Aeromicrobium marinum DSM 15272 TaxID=585531 RepID=E2SE54_9ACTN|nr:flavin reductase family protein [Aeromicrobium marinum]EFQ82781.1 flavin reductase-like protein [Aeromicrobium marinum DSM 15272]